MQDTFIMHVEYCQGNLGSPVYYLFFFKFVATLILLLLKDELVEVPAIAELHYDIKFLTFNDGLAIADYVDMFELLEKFNLIENIFSLLLVLVGEFYLFDDKILIGLEVSG